MTAIATAFKRDLLGADVGDQAAELLQDNLATLIDLALNLKQAHWVVVGKNFRSVHLQLDEIIDSVRLASDEVAERIVTIGRIPDGRARTVTDTTHLEDFPDGLLQVEEVIESVGDRLKTTTDQLRSAIRRMGDIDPISEDLLISISRQLEKHLWMVQAQELG